MRRNRIWLIIIIALAIFALWVSLPDNAGIVIDSNGDGTPEVNFSLRQSLGLDLVGGLRVLLAAQLPDGSYTAGDLQQAANNVARRVNGLGVTEATVQVQGSNRILVELPGVTDPQQAVDTIQATALLEFVNFSGLGAQAADYDGRKILTTRQFEIASENEVQPEGEVSPLTGQPFQTVMDGSGLQAASPQYQNGQWFISFELTPEGAAIFGPYTGANVGQPMAIVLDGTVLSAPVINAQLTDGGIIEGNFTEQEAQQLALQLRSGALPIPLAVESAETVGATLGQQSINLSIRAGIIGIVIVLLFMVIYYRVPGVAADLALLVFIILNLALFKLIPITLTLPAITGFLISVGTAVDGNVLIFERIKEELRAGKPLNDAIEAGFNRAWRSIRDSNMSTIIICAILFLFGQTPGASVVSGFAITLALGLVINLFTAVLVTGTFLRLLVALFHRPLTQRAWLLGA
ncbi:MAG: protein-export membrane protein SecD [Chloroflexi bacterium OLB15]|nr:MAG: protein-export membrane protein SecD [Chloroflexi bacterium OLB15]